MYAFFCRKALLDYEIEMTCVDSSAISTPENTLLPTHLLPPSSRSPYGFVSNSSTEKPL